MARRMNYNRKQSSSLVPNFTGQSESDREEDIIRRMGKGAYYAMKGRIRRAELGDFNPEAGLTREQLQAVYAHKRKVKAKIERLQMIKELAEL
jgi:hypothetical protein